MKVDEGWRQLGWKHPLWDYVRFFCSIRSRTRQSKDWVAKLRDSVFEIEPGTELTVREADLELLLRYLDERESFHGAAYSSLRTKDQAISYCERLKFKVGITSTKLEGWTNSPKAMVAAVTNIARATCAKTSLDLVESPQKRCVWVQNNALHVSARNLDGAIPSLFRPRIVWEVKEYWGGGEGKAGGSKMSDAVYECNLVGRELREFEDRTGHQRVAHVVFLDGRDQWGARSSDLKRMVDLFHQGIIDYLFIGREVETDWSKTLTRLL